LDTSFRSRSPRLETVPGGENDERRQLKSEAKFERQENVDVDLHFGAVSCKVLGRSDTYK